MSNMGSTFANGIVNDLFKASGLDFDEHYKAFFWNAMAAIEQDIDQLKRYILYKVEEEFNRNVNISEAWSESIKARKLDLINKEDYCKGFNNCRAEHKAIMSEINNLIIDAVTRAMDKIMFCTAEEKEKSEALNRRWEEEQRKGGSE